MCFLLIQLLESFAFTVFHLQLASVRSGVEVRRKASTAVNYFNENELTPEEMEFRLKFFLTICLKNLVNQS